MNKYNVKRIFYRLSPGMVPITFLSRNTAGGIASDATTPYKINLAQWRKVKKQEINAASFIGEHIDLVWKIWKDQLEVSSCPYPKKDDSILDQYGVTWIVKIIDIKLFGNVFEMMCQRASVNPPT